MMNKIDNSSFMKWLIEELKKHGWTLNSLATRGGFSATQIYYVEQNKRKLGPDVANMIARAFELDPEYVYRKAGILGTHDEVTADVELVTHLMTLMTSAEREIVIGMVESVASRSIGRRGHVIQERTSQHEEDGS